VALLARPLIVAFVALWHWDSLFALLLLFDPIQWAMLAVALFLARSALRSLRLMRTGSAPATIFEPLLRTNVARAAWIGCLCFTLLFSGFLGYEINQVWPAMIGAIRQSIDDGQLLAGPQLPGCDSPQVVQLVNKLVRDLNIAPSISAIDGHRQISFDATAQRRVGLCIAHTKPSAIPIVYTITWLDRDKRQFSVSVQIGSDLPPQTKS
ncbi:MAG TPA: hypothetical protein VFB80_06080, partial [Pirellulaceae bacterium]|nr:hypothetical protein [Pirellulaceae bacterium]